MILSDLSGNLSFPNSKRRGMDLVTFKCPFQGDISWLYGVCRPGLGEESLSRVPYEEK